ncbi:MAG: imidazole glycerol-phosphate synthase subunit HisF [Thermoanaerobaculia bacterium]|jgi:cyclase|nr:imidazole glycerol-phosphate synthase subunit HisF [Thermoanaerobaculia bacterium]
MDVIPSLDLLGSQVVRLLRGDYATVTSYGDPESVLDSLDVPRGSRLHLVDLEASRSGRPVELAIVRRFAQRDLRVQVGGGIRSLADAQAWIDAGVEKVVIGTVAADSPDVLRAIVDALGASRVIAAIDVRDGVVRVGGWERDASTTLDEVLTRVESLGITEALITDINKDGAMCGPSFALYRSLQTKLRIIASGGVSTLGDVVSLSRLGSVGGCVIGRALLDRRIRLAEARARVATPNAIPERIIPCLDVRDGRVVKGVNFVGIRDAGDPVECATRYETEGADELVILDISATDSNRTTALDTVRRVSESLFIPLTVGGGVRTIEDFRALLRAGADRVAINTAALRNPQLIADCAREFGVQAVVLSCDAKHVGDRFEAMVRSGKESSNVDAVEWCKRAEELGTGEILLTSVDRDGTNAGYDIELLRAVTRTVRISVIASGGAGALEHFRDAIEAGGARAVLAASLFHDRRLSIGDVKRYLAAEGIPVR